jgi:uncharacterized protein (DUF433 family)
MFDIGSLLTEGGEIRGGRPRIAGTGITVSRIASWYKLGYSAEQIKEKIEHLTLAQVFAALAYYHANFDEIEADLAAQEAANEAAELAYRRQHAPVNS